MTKSIILAAVVSAFALSSLFAIPPASAQQSVCDAKAVDKKKGLPLSGAAKTSSINACMKRYCEAHAVSGDGKALKGAARTSSIDKCMKG